MDLVKQPLTWGSYVYIDLREIEIKVLISFESKEQTRI
jgi:hypothetical protein